MARRALQRLMHLWIVWGLVIAGVAGMALLLVPQLILPSAAIQLLSPAADQAVVAIGNQQRLTQQTLDTLLPPLTQADQPSRQVKRSFPEDIPSIERHLWSVIQIDPRIGHQVLYGDHNGNFVAIRRVGLQHYQIIARKNRQEVQTTYRHIDAVRAEPLEIVNSYDPRNRPWYRWAVERGSASWAPIYSDFVNGQTRQVLTAPVYRPNGQLQGVVLVDAGIAPYSMVLERQLPAVDAAAYLIDGADQVFSAARQGKVTSDFDPPTPLLESPVRAIWEHNRRQSTEYSVAAFRVSGEEMSSWALVRPIDGPHGLRWHLAMTVPENIVWQHWWFSLLSKQAAGLLTVSAVLALLLLLFWYHAKRQIHTMRTVVSRATTNWPAETQVAALPSELREIADRVQSMSRQLRTDALTGVLNRATLVAQVEACQAKLLSQPALPGLGPTGYTLLFIDLNGFKAINDTHGHGAGDRVLKHVARRLKQAVRREDAVSRFGGDEFVVYLHGIVQPEAINLTCTQLRTAIETTIKLESGIEVAVGGAIGVASYPRDAQSFDELARVADERMYAAKQAMKRRTADTTKQLIPDASIQRGRSRRRPRKDPRLSIKKSTLPQVRTARRRSVAQLGIKLGVE